MSKIILTTEEELETLIKKALNELITPLGRTDSTLISTASEIMSIKEASEFLNIARQTLYGYTCHRTIPHFKKGKKLYFKRAELLEWITEGERKT